MHTGFVMLPEMIKSPCTDLIVGEDKKMLPMVIEECCTALISN